MTADGGGPDPSARAARRAVAVVFFVDGALSTGLFVRLRDVQVDLGLSNTALGAAVTAYGVGALLLGLLAGRLLRRFTSARASPACAVVLAVALALAGSASSWAAFAALLALAGAASSLADLSANEQGLRVEQLYRRSILNGLHAVWSIGAVVGAGVGAVAADLRVPVGVHLGVAGLLFASAAVVAARRLLPGPGERRAAAPGGPGRWAQLLSAAAPLAVLGLIASMGQVAEDVGSTWAAVYLRGDLGTSALVGAAALVALQAAQTVGRLVGDAVVTRFGDRTVARTGAALAGGAMTAALLAPAPATTVVAFGVVGLGIGTLIPASMRAADAVPGLPAGTGMVAVGTVDRVLLLLSPVVVGLVADAAGLRVALGVIPLAALVVLVLSPALPGRARRA